MRRPALVLTALLGTTAGAAGVDLPPRAPGQWEMSVQVDTAAMPPQVIRMCLDVETDRLLHDRLSAVARQKCSRDEQRRDGDDIVLDSECRAGGVTTSAHTVVSGDFASVYSMKTQTKLSGLGTAVAPQGASSQDVTISARRTGACGAAMKAGDIDLGAGATINVRDLPDAEAPR